MCCREPTAWSQKLRKLPLKSCWSDLPAHSKQDHCEKRTAIGQNQCSSKQASASQTLGLKRPSLAKVDFRWSVHVVPNLGFRPTWTIQMSKARPLWQCVPPVRPAGCTTCWDKTRRNLFMSFSFYYSMYTYYTYMHIVKPFYKGHSLPDSIWAYTVGMIVFWCQNKTVS